MSQNRDFEVSPFGGLEPLDVVVLLVGTILALIPLIGLALNHSPLGITFSSALASLSLLPVALVLIAIVLRRHTKAEGLPRGRSGNRLRPVLYGIKAVVLRYANVVGPRLRHGVVWDFVNKLRKDPSGLEILGDGKQMRSYIHVSDAVEATMIAWMKNTNAFEVYNIASENWVTVNDVADEVVKAMGLGNVKRVYRPVLHGVGWLGDVKGIALSIDKLKASGFKPVTIVERPSD